MTLSIRAAEPRDIDEVSSLLLADAESRTSMNPDLWRMDSDAQDKTKAHLTAAMTTQSPPFRQKWMVADNAGQPIGVAHSILLPVPPIYAGEFGPPGLIMEDCYLTQSAPEGTQRALLDAAEADLVAAGAKILLASSVPGGDWQGVYKDHGYEPLTLYFAKTGLAADQGHSNVRPATAQDVPLIVASSAEHRNVLERINLLFWRAHKDADTRFGAWMERSLTLQDRDMFVEENQTRFGGYAISQPATPLHFPTPHDISGVGVIDDFFHMAFSDIERLGPDIRDAAALFTAAEAARSARGDHSVLVVCPAAWTTKITLLQQLGYHNAITWFLKHVD